MERDLFLKNVSDQFLDLEAPLNFDSNFRDVDSYDSLTGMTIMVMIKDEYGVDITESQYRAQKTIEELYNFVAENKE